MMFNSLSHAVRKRLGLEKVDVGGPFSGYVWRVHTGCSVAELNKALKKVNFPFVVT